MFEGGGRSTQHSMNDVPVVLVTDPKRELKQPEDARQEEREGWSLCDVAPTLMELLGQELPESWTGLSLLK